MMNHYDLQCAQWAQRISTLDPIKLQKKLPELHRVGHTLRLWHFNRQISVNLNDGLLQCISDSNPLSLNEKLNIYTLLWYCKENATLSGHWLPFHSMKDASPFAPAFEKSVLKTFARSFDGNEDLLNVAINTLGGSRINQNSYFLPAFSCIPLRLQFWDGDEEFPAQGNILFDQNATEFIHVESLVTIASQCVTSLLNAVHLPLCNDIF